MRRASFSVFAGLAVAASVLMSVPHEARACGGCMHQPSVADTVITDHRMVLSVSTTQTVLWDQIRYSGNPVEFAWVLPVRKGSKVEMSRDAWIAALDASTQTIITGPSLTCGGTRGGVQEEGDGAGCGSVATEDPESLAIDAGFAGNSQVQIVNEEVVGPYDAVTLESTNPNALEDWLTQNGFVLPDTIRPIVMTYVSQGFDFIALRLAPGQGVQAMQPVRVTTPGADPTMPLRMVAAGVGANVGLELYVITEGRYHPQNFPDEVVDLTKLTWDQNINQSNYETLVSAALANDGGKGWLTEYAAQPDTTVTGTVGPGFDANGVPINPGLGDAYMSQCIQYPPELDCPDASSDASIATGPDGGVGRGSDAASSACGQLRLNSCDTFDDLDLALAGLHPGSVWVTRIRAFFPGSALGSADLLLEPHPSQTPVSNVHHTDVFADGHNPCATATANNAKPATSSASACDVAPRLRTRVGTYFMMALTVFGLAGILRRKRR